MALTEQDIVNCILAEYQEMRSELRSYFQIQMTTITIGASLLGLLLTYGIGLFSGGEASPLRPMIAVFLFPIFIPAATCFLGIVWLDHTYRQVKVGAYISTLEDKLSALMSEQELKYSLIGWEHWNKKQILNASFLKRTNQYYYYFCCFLFFVLPIGSLVIWLLLDFPAFSYLISGSIGFSAIYFGFFLFSRGFIQQIMSLSSEIETSSAAWSRAAPASASASTSNMHRKLSRAKRRAASNQTLSPSGRR